MITFKNGQIDGFVTAGSWPAPNVIEAAAGTGVRVLSLDDAQIKKTKRTKLVIPAGTYKGHYVGGGEYQTVDIWNTLGSAATTCRDTAIKYLMRYGKKDGHNKKDLLKAVHYITLLNHYTQEEDNDSSSK